MKANTKIMKKFHALKSILGKRYEKYLGENIRNTWYEYCYQECRPIPSDVIYVNPKRIEYVINPPWRQSPLVWRSGTYIRGGDWDKRPTNTNEWYDLDYDDPSIMTFKKYKIYTSMREHFTEGVPWEQTDWYRWVVKNPHGQYKNENSIKSQLHKVDSIYEQIRKEGYKTQKELVGESTKPFPEYDEVRINIGRDGELYFDEGRHRLSISKILNLSEIPVRILVRHKKWQEKRCKKDNQFLNHPDFSTLSN